jgi:hypothetical protein
MQKKHMGNAELILGGHITTSMFIRVWRKSRPTTGVPLYLKSNDVVLESLSLTKRTDEYTLSNN